MTERPVPAGDPTGGAPEPPAPLGSWARLYALVFAVLVLDVLLLYWLTERFR